MPGAIDAIRDFVRQEYLIIIITNQSGIARGYYTETDYVKLMEWLKVDMQKKGVPIAGCYHCPHHPEGIIPKYAISCDCRKPKTGLFWKAKEEFNLDMDACIAIGDKPRDLEICKETKMQGYLLDYNSDCIKNMDRLGSNVKMIKRWSALR